MGCHTHCRVIFQEINDDTQSADDIRTEIEEAKAKLELTTTVNANVIEQYEKREAEVCIYCLASTTRIDFSDPILDIDREAPSEN